MDYTLVHYRADEWERRAFEHARDYLRADGWRARQLRFEPGAYTLGLAIDLDLGNIVKANRFGFVKRAAHGRQMLEHSVQRATYARTQVDLGLPRWRFMNTLFSLSEACLFSQLVDAIDEGVAPKGAGYADAFRAVGQALDATHLEGQLKGEIIERPEHFVVLDEELPLALMDLKSSGKQLMVITNSEWEYTRAMMSYAFDRYLPQPHTWRDLFDLVIVAARKPGFFSGDAPAFELVDDSGLFRPLVGPLKKGGVYAGGNARLVEQFLERPGEQILYVGDHIFADVHVSKEVLRWRTCLILRELETELSELYAFAADQAELDALMSRKESIERTSAQLRLGLQRAAEGYGPAPEHSIDGMKKRLVSLRSKIDTLDRRIGPLSERAGRLGNERWGPLLRAGNDKSHLARQIERRADIYTSRVSNLLAVTPYAYLRSPRGSLPHDPVLSSASDDRA